MSRSTSASSVVPDLPSSPHEAATLCEGEWRSHPPSKVCGQTMMAYIGRYCRTVGKHHERSIPSFDFYRFGTEHRCHKVRSLFSVKRARRISGGDQLGILGARLGLREEEPTRAEHTMGFGDHLRGMIEVVQHVAAHHAADTMVAKRQLQGVGLYHRTRRHPGEHRGRSVDTNPSRMGRQPGSEASEAAANVEYGCKPFRHEASGALVPILIRNDPGGVPRGRSSQIRVVVGLDRTHTFIVAMPTDPPQPQCWGTEDQLRVRFGMTIHHNRPLVCSDSRSASPSYDAHL